MLGLEKLSPDTLLAAPIRLLVYGTPGAGKSTLVASAPGVVVVHGEEGTNQIRVARCPSVANPASHLPENYADFLAMLAAVRDEPHSFASLAIDTLDGIEALLVRHVCREGNVDGLEKYGGGYGAGARRVASLLNEALSLLEQIRARRKMRILLTAHVSTALVGDPTGEDYVTHSPSLSRGVTALLHGWCDAVLLARFESATDVARKGKWGGKGKQVLTGRRVLCTNAGSGFVAKNRYGFQDILPLHWPNGWAAIQEQLDAPARVAGEVEALFGKDSVAARGVDKEKSMAWIRGAGANACEAERRKTVIEERIKEEKAKKENVK